MSKAVLIGSRALNYWYPEMTLPSKADWDVVSLVKIEGTEWHDRFILNNDDLYKYTSEDATIEYNGRTLYVLSLKGLSLVKRSHLYRDLKFSKHIAHYWRYLEKEACQWDSDDLKFLDERTEMTKIAYPQGYPKLNKSVKDFFDDAVTKKYDHDYLHKLFAYQENPMYTKLQTDSSMAWCKKELWDKLSKTEKLQCVAEEAYVISVERFLVPAQWDFYAKLAFNLAVNKICTTLCSGYFRDFAIDNYPNILRMFDKNKIEYTKLVLERN